MVGAWCWGAAMFDQYDVLAVVGVGLLACGAYLAYGTPALLTVIGLALLIVGVLGAWQKMDGKGS